MRNYLSIESLLGLCDNPQCYKIYQDHKDILETSAGSTYNHHAWQGGYIGHVEDVMNLAIVMYNSLELNRPLPFELKDALVVLFLHDLEKPWKYQKYVKFADKAARALFRETMLLAYKIDLTEDQKNALKYVEGEGDDYSNTQRVMGPPAAFCHMCDVASARIWWDYPKVRGEF